MPSKATCCGEKAVVVAVYVEKLKRQRISSSPSRRHHHHHHHHHHHRHLHVRERLAHHKGSRGYGYDRRAELLLYSQHLREAASGKSAANTPAHRPPSPPTNQQHLNKVLSVRRKSKYSPTCLGDWKKLSIPSFMRSLVSFNWQKDKKKRSTGSTTNKMNTIVKSLDIKKKWGFVTKFLSKLQKRR